MMVQAWSTVVSVSVDLLAAAGIAYVLLAIFHVRRFRELAHAHGQYRPAISVMKPLCGGEPRLYECLRSFVDQEYPDFQIVFGVREASDPAVSVVARLRAEFPDRDITLVVDARIHGPNLKVSNLLNMLPACRHDVLVVADSDVRVGRQALATVVDSLENPRVGAVSCLYKGVPAAGHAARLGGLFINDWFLPSALVDEALNGVDGCFGPMIALRRRALAEAGGFEALVDYLAEDNRLGRLVRRAGWEVRLSHHAVETMVEEADLRGLISHEVRWGRTVRACRAADHALSVITFPLPLLLVPLFLVPTSLTLVLVSAYVGLRVVLHQVVRRRFVLSASPFSPWLVPVRECLCFAVWAVSLLGQRVTWRGRVYRITAEGRLIPTVRGLDSYRWYQARAASERNPLRTKSKLRADGMVSETSLETGSACQEPATAVVE
ncbi:MAG: bacteriohopanetetrol glucosamine biosynthesis glycosyltransferase HpnI [Alphaproteobacteria bacterium]